MKHGSYIALFFLGLWMVAPMSAQNELDSSLCYFEQEEIVIVLKKDQMLKDALAFLETMDMRDFSDTTAWVQMAVQSFINEGWKVVMDNEQLIELRKPVTDLLGGLDEANKWIITQPDLVADGPDESAFFAFNPEPIPSIEQKEGLKVQFRLKGYPIAQKVYLAGSFNKWSTLATPMRLTANGWVAEVEVVPGHHEYKFIVDGRWITDPANPTKVPNYVSFKNFNSVYVQPNTKFVLKGKNDADQVFVAGSFNDWNPKATALNKDGDQWVKEVYLRQGSYTYKFVVDGDWIADPANPNIVKDGAGNYNSLLLFGETTLFQLKGHSTANQVYLAGSFNDWRPDELAMEKTEEGWFIPFVLAPGNYEYKFVVDGRWILDPANPHVLKREHQDPNSLMSIDPNHTFKLPGHLSAQEVSLMTNLLGWPDPGVRMNRGKDGWYLPLYLPEGKCAYKFKVDGEYQLDNESPYIEDNEYGTQNSVFWVE